MSESFVRLFYDLLYMVPIYLAALSAADEFFVDFPVRMRFVCCIGIGILVLAASFRHIKSRMRYLLAVVPVVFVLVMFLIRGKEDRLDALTEWEWLLWVVLTALGSVLAGILISEFRMVRRMFSIGIGGGLLVIMVMGIVLPKLTAASLFFILIMEAAEEIQIGWKKSGYTERKGHLLFIAPFLLAVGVFVCLAPAPKEPYDWEFAVNAWNRIVESVRRTESFFRLRGGREDYAGVIGFSTSGGFADSLKHQAKEMMLLQQKSGGGAQDVIYLRGKVFDIFDGQNWHTAKAESETEAENELLMDTMETYGAVSAFDPEHVTDYLRKAEVILTYQNVSTRYLFMPLKAYPDQTKIKNTDFAVRREGVLSEKPLGYETEYHVVFDCLNQEHEVFRQFLNSAQKTDNASTENGTDQEMRLYRERIYKNDLPRTDISQKTQAYLNVLLSGAETDYEKLKKLEEMLRALRFSDNPGAYPREIDSAEGFLDYFLFQRQEGYCSYFATAFVLLARSQGIPARYVQGYDVPIKAGERVMVTSDMAHAWAEAYLEGVGWIMFEPTPGKEKQTGWAVSTREKDAVKKGASEDDATEEKTEENDAIFLPELVDTPVKTKHPVDGVRIIIAVFVSFLVMILFWGAGRLRDALRYQKLDEREKFRIMCERNRRLLACIGLRLQTGETIREFLARAAEMTDGIELASLKRLEEVLYAEAEVTRETCQLAECDNIKLKEKLTGAKGLEGIWNRLRILGEGM